LQDMKLAEARKRAGYSTQAFAKATGASTRTISEVETGRRLPQPRTMRNFAEVLGVAVEKIDEFRDAVRREASRGAPPEVLDQAEHMEELFEVDLVDANFIRAAARRSLQEVMEYLVRSGHAEDVDRIYREVRGKATTREEANRRQDTER
jgi:transcriptional regulator with XRE-family HTH domain